ncbi:PLP-dependent cysteine synthase family protein [Riemerella anatipestifer]|uniref:Pyridoxal-5'-phosphate-dependent protein beta subunit n=1 Tax=Riemerella anatipestifer (strain ATCC 11845 / DSM 15868 / JCM 9532 / NCTC 11014) TaxID=693978 RepID=E4T9F9_RIEAD|nr:cysteine synthase family protein [Riemerella anatipestifer]ADQ81640.1 Pyridoxal-5'-phosphate-dependent protein beta subunit [Riemerella anatipestifer ATCC 11845 = DSM 15868]AFD55653.1 pyridoxal-5'-phosphate-dependent protein beta subunit [Riemerella anatipestifer ATCC 11845 = DSM 15868]MRM91771.1 cysteine synthase family protein [Riemerella anatipestifer]MSN90018.1 cysteine synthase family protein [Riemerella anatipestifer]SNV54912.1 Putative cystathionine beta-synthase Rv1077 [Riemerella a
MATNVYDNILGLIGNTPLVRLNKITENIAATVYAKIESSNPGHSTKDRIALHIIEQAEKKGLLKPGATIVETTSGNTGFSIAMVNIIKGYKCILSVSDKTKPEKIAYLKALGATVYVCPANVPADDPRSYYEVAKRIAKETPNSIYINQYFNELNIDAHYSSTGPEIWEQTQGKITHLIACTGTGGTLSGSAKYLKEQNPDIKIIGVDADGSILKTYHETGAINKEDIHPYQIEGLGKNLIPTALRFDLIDEFVRVNDEQSAYRTREIAIKEGIMGGYTTGAVTQALMQYAEENPFKEDDLVVLIYPDHGSRYISKVYNDEWMESQGFTNNELHNYDKLFKTEHI